MNVDPYYNFPKYLPQSSSMTTSWEDTLPRPSVSLSQTNPPELYYYTTLSTVAMASLTTSSVSLIVDPLQGLMNQYQASIFVINVT
jgi:hypothetical protein